MMANVNDKNTTVSPTLDSAIAQLPDPGPVSDCNVLGTRSVHTNAGKKFQLACNSVWSGDDYDQQFHMSLESCMGACASNATGCGGISYQTSQAFGFKNCYLKTKAPAAPDQLTQRPDTDTAIMMLEENDNPEPVTSVVSVTSTVTRSMVTSTTVVVTTEVMTRMVPITGTPSPVVSPTGAAGATGPTQLEGTPQNPTAKTTGAVVGAVALVGLVALAIWFFRRQRHDRAPASMSNAAREDEKAWRRQADEASSERGNAPLVRTETIVTVSSSRTGSLRDSQNGLKQHRYPEPLANLRAGIPPEFAGPPPNTASR